MCCSIDCGQFAWQQPFLKFTQCVFSEACRACRRVCKAKEIKAFGIFPGLSWTKHMARDIVSNKILEICEMLEQFHNQKGKVTMYLHPSAQCLAITQ